MNASKAFAERLPTPPPPAELFPEVPAGTVCVQWYGGAQGEQANMLYLLRTSSLHTLLSLLSF